MTHKTNQKVSTLTYSYTYSKPNQFECVYDIMCNVVYASRICAELNWKFINGNLFNSDLTIEPFEQTMSTLQQKEPPRNCNSIIPNCNNANSFPMYRKREGKTDI